MVERLLLFYTWWSIYAYNTTGEPRRTGISPGLKQPIFKWSSRPLGGKSNAASATLFVLFLVFFALSLSLGYYSDNCTRDHDIVGSVSPKPETTKIKGGNRPNTRQNPTDAHSAPPRPRRK